MLYNHSDFARYLFTKWYMENKITLADLGHALEVGVVIEFCSYHKKSWLFLEILLYRKNYTLTETFVVWRFLVLLLNSLIVQ